MSKTPRLPCIINRYIEEKWLRITSNFLPEHDSSIPDFLDQRKIDTPFKGIYSGVSITDGTYSIPARCNIAVPQNSSILVKDWSLNYNSHLELEILDSELLSEKKSFKDSPIIPIESNPSVDYTLRKFRFEKIKHEEIEVEEGREEEITVLGLILKGASQGTEDLSQRQVDLSVLKTPEVQIGFGQNSHKKAQEFSKTRTKQDTGKDILEMLDKEIERESREMAITTSYDIGIEVFPRYALDYLKVKYSVVT